MDLKNNKTTIYITGALFGALVGLTAAYLLEKTAELEETGAAFYK